VYGVVYQIIDQQRMINRTISLWDMIMGASAKGVLMIPEECLDGHTVEEFAEQWVKFNGVIVYKPSKTNPNALPQQITANAVPVGISDMLQLQMSLLQDISGVHGAIQGKTPQAGTSGKLYQQETTNSSLNTLDLMKTFSAFREVRDRKLLKIAMQYYKGKRTIISEETGEPITIDADMIRDVDFDLSIIQNTDTPSAREAQDNILLELVQGQIIPPEVYLQSASNPVVKKAFELMKQASPQQSPLTPEGGEAP
jgi:hypothetical protein